MTAETQHARTRPVDVGIAAVLLLFGLGGTGPAGADQPGTADPDAIAFTLVAVAAVSLVGWRRFPVHVFLLTGGVIALYLALAYPFGPVLFSGAFAAGALAVGRPLRLVAQAGAADLVLIGAALLVRAAVLGPVGWFTLVTHLMFAVVWVVLPGAVGFAVRVRRDAARHVREEQARRAVSEERLRMAQEVHDVVGHGLAVIAMQAGAGLHVLDRRPDRAREALEAIQRTSRESLEELRAELAALRGDAGEDSPHRPSAGLADVVVLVQRVRSGGLDVHLDMADGPAPVAEEVDLAAYRIVQEALTNVLRHGGPSATAQVGVRAVRGRLLVEVRDTGTGPPAGRYDEGSGITGMRQRAQSVGGDLEAGPRPGGGFAVTARLPLPAPVTEEEA